LNTEHEKASSEAAGSSYRKSTDRTHREESPDIDRIHIRESKDTQPSQSSAKWYKLVAMKDGKLVSVVRILFEKR